MELEIESVVNLFIDKIPDEQLTREDNQVLANDAQAEDRSGR